MEENQQSIKSIHELQKKKFGEQWKENFTMIFKYDWIFSKGWEKIFIIGSIAWAFYSLLKLVVGLL